MVSRQRLGIQLALALLGIGFFTWNEKKGQARTEDRLLSIQTYYSSFLEKGKTPTKESFGISALDRPEIMPKISSDTEIDITERFQNFLNENPTKTVDPRCMDSDSDSDNEEVCDTFFEAARAIVKTVLIKTRISINLAVKINAKPKHLAKNINFTESSLLLLGNSMFGPNEGAGNRVDAILKGYGLERVHMPKDGNCLFSSISFFIVNIQSAGHPERDAKLREHLETLGILNISKNNDLSEISHQLRKLVVKEFLGSNMLEYSSFLISAEKISYEEIAKNFENDGFFDCELGNATILALANIMRIGIVVFTSLENYPVITIVPRNEPIACTTVYLAFEQLGAGHYDAVIESIVLTEQTALAEETEPGLHDNRTQPATYDYSNAQISNPACRCGQGGAKNKQDRQFCAEYKSGCKCFRNLKGCIARCGCRNCANPYGVRVQGQNEISSETQVRKRRKHVKSPETGRNFIIGRGDKVTDAPWSLFEELLCCECALYMGGTEEITSKGVTDLYNKVVVLIKSNSIHLPTDELIDSELQRIDQKDMDAVERFLKKLYMEDKNFKEKIKQQITLNCK